MGFDQKAVAKAGQTTGKAAQRSKQNRSKTVQAEQKKAPATTTEKTKTTSRTSSSKLYNSSTNSTNQQQHKQQNKQYKHFGRSKAARVGFSHNNSNKEARMRGGKLRQRGLEPRKVGGRGRSVFSWKFGGIPANLLQLVEVKGVPVGCGKNVNDIWENQRL